MTPKLIAGIDSLLEVAESLKTLIEADRASSPKPDHNGRLQFAIKHWNKAHCLLGTHGGDYKPTESDLEEAAVLLLRGIAWIRSVQSEAYQTGYRSLYGDIPVKLVTL